MADKHWDHEFLAQQMVVNAAPEPPPGETLLDRAFTLRQCLTDANGMLMDVLGDTEAVPADGRGIDKQHPGLTEELRLAAMLAIALRDRAAQLQRIVGRV